MSLFVKPEFNYISKIHPISTQDKSNGGLTGFSVETFCQAMCAINLMSFINLAFMKLFSPYIWSEFHMEWILAVCIKRPINANLSANYREIISVCRIWFIEKMHLSLFVHFGMSLTIPCFFRMKSPYPWSWEVCLNTKRSYILSDLKKRHFRTSEKTRSGSNTLGTR